MKHKLAARGAAIAIAAMMTAGLGTGSVREAMASTRIPAKGVTETVSNNGLKISPTVTVSPTAEAKNVPEHQTLTPEAEKREENQPSPASEKAEISETPAAELSPSAEIEEEAEKDTADPETGDEKEKNAIKGDAEAVSPIPEVTEGNDQKSEKKAVLLSLRKERKNIKAVANPVSSDARSDETENPQTTSGAESRAESTDESASESFPSAGFTTPTEELKEAEGDGNGSVSSEASAGEKEAESEEAVSAQKESSDEKNPAETNVQEKDREEKNTAILEPTAEPADLPSNAPIPEPSKETESETVLVGDAGQMQTVGASSGATQIVGDTTKRYETNAARAVITATPERNTGVSNKGDLLAPKASNQSSSSGSRTASSSGNQTNGRSSGTSAGNKSYEETSRRRIRTSTPQTGDHSGVILYAMMAGASLAAAVAAILALKRER